MGNSFFFSLSYRDFDSLSKENVYENNKQVRYCSLYKIISLSTLITFFSVVSITSIFYIYPTILINLDAYFLFSDRYHNRQDIKNHFFYSPNNLFSEQFLKG